MTAYPDADIGLDHNSVIGMLKFKKKTDHKQNKSMTYDISFLSDRDEMLKDEFNNIIKHIRFDKNNNESENIEDQ